MPPFNKAAEYRRLAQQNREFARYITLNDARRQLLEAARHLEILAEAEDRRTGKGKPMGSSEPEA